MTFNHFLKFSKYNSFFLFMGIIAVFMDDSPFSIRMSVLEAISMASIDVTLFLSPIYLWGFISGCKRVKGFRKGVYISWWLGVYVFYSLWFCVNFV